MKRIARTSFWTIAFGLILLFSVSSLSAQKRVTRAIAPLAEDTAINPHDFTNEFYEQNGILWKSLQNRRNGSDGLSVFGRSSNPSHTDIRVIATVPAYDHYGRIVFWYPLGEVDENGFTPDQAGSEARDMARMFPMYVFPDSRILDYRLFANTRQAALIDNTWSDTTGQDMNPLGYHEVFFVTYTAKAFSKEGLEMMSYMMKKNGPAADDTPILSTLADLQMMLTDELVSVTSTKAVSSMFAIAPPLLDPSNGVIAKDSFLWMPTKDGLPLPSEAIFVETFNCFQVKGALCMK